MPEERLRGLREFTFFETILRASPGRAPEEGNNQRKMGKGVCGKAWERLW